MAQLKDLLVEGKSRFIDKIYASDQFISKVVQGTPPFLIDSSTLVSNLNADLVDGQHFSYANTNNTPTYLWGTSSNGTNYLVSRASMHSGIADKIVTVTRSTDAWHYPTFVDSDNSTATEESLYTAGGLRFNPSTRAIAIGTTSKATGSGAIAAGTYATADGTNAVAIGGYVTAIGSGAFARGTFVSAAHGNGISTAFGSNWAWDVKLTGNANVTSYTCTPAAESGMAELLAKFWSTHSGSIKNAFILGGRIYDASLADVTITNMAYSSGTLTFTFSRTLSATAISNKTYYIICCIAGGEGSFINTGFTGQGAKWSLAGGRFSMALGDYGAISYGHLNIAGGGSSAAFGNHTLTYNNGEFACGSFNNSVSGSTKFSVGIGSADNARKNAFEIVSNGNAFLNGVFTINAPAYSANATWTYPGGSYASVASPNIRLIGDSSYGLSTIEFISQKGETSINKPSDCAFIQFQPYGTTTQSAVGSQPTLATSGELNRLVIGVNNDATDTLVLQTPSTTGLKHAVGTGLYTIWDSGNDGSGSGLDADLLDGKHASDFSLAHSHPYLPLAGGTMTGTIYSGSGLVQIWRGSATSGSAGYNTYLAYSGGNIYLATYGSTNTGKTVYLETYDTDLYHRKNLTNYKIWDEGNDGSGSGLDADLLDGYNSTDFYIKSVDMYGLENLCIDVVQGGQTTRVNDNTIQTSGTTSDTYFYVKTCENLVSGQIYTFGFYVTGYTGSNTWTFAASNNSSCVQVKINKNGWVWGTGTMIVSGNSASAQILIDDLGSTAAQALTFSNFVVVKGNIFPYYTVPISKMSVSLANTANKLGTSNVGAADRPIYLAAGVPTQTTYRMAGTNAAATTALAISSDLDTGIWYVSGTGTSDLYSISDGVAYVNKYSNSWIAEIYQDYRTGQIALRGKNNGTWQAWRKVFDSVNYTSFLNGTYLRKVTVPNNAANDFNTFENMTLTGRGDPTTGASLSNAPWTGAGPAGGYGVLTYLWSGYGTQLAFGYGSNKVYIRYKSYSNNAATWSSTWDSLLLASEFTTSNITGILPISKGGTDASTAAGARANLGTWSLVSDSYNTLMPADGTTNSWVKIGTSNTSYGILPSTSGGAGSGHNYIGTSSWYWKYAYIDDVHFTTLNINNKLVIDSTGRIIPYSTSTRNAGNYGYYDSTLLGHIWSIGTSYSISADGKSPNTLYGLAYFHTNWSNGSNNDGSKTAKGTYAGGHQVAWFNNGVLASSIGDNIYTKGQFISKKAQGTAPLVVDSSTQVTNLKSNFAQYADVLRDPTYHTLGSRRNSANITFADGGLHYYLATSSMSAANGKPAADGHILHMAWDNSKYDAQLTIPTSATGVMQWRVQTNGTDASWSPWKTVIDSSNYSSYLGYIGTTAVQASSANQALTGITSINGRLTIGANSDLTSIGFGGIHNVEFGEAGYAHREYYFRPSYGANGVTYTSLNIQNASAAASPTFTTTHRLDFNGNAYHSGNIYLDTGDSDRFIQFRYNSNNYAGSAWRLLSRGSGSGDANYFDIETGGSSSSANTWYRALRLTMDNRYVGLSVDAPTQKLHVGGNARFDGGIGSKGTNGNVTGSYVAHPGGGVYTTNASSVTGYLKITLPHKGYNTMMSFDVTIYTYEGTNQSYTTYHISGYEYSTNGWYNPVTKVYSEGIGPYTNLTVRLGNDGTYACVTIGEANTVWSYPQVTVHNIMTGYSGCDVDTWIGGWAVGFTTTALTTVVSEKTAVNTQNINVSGSAGSVAWGNITGKPSSFTPADHNHDGRYLQYNGWWTNNDGKNVDDASGMVFAYRSHGVPTGWGILTTFDYQNNSSYKMQLFSYGYTNGYTYYRNRSADRNGWNAWVRFLDSTNYTEYLTDTKVTQTVTASSNTSWRPLLLGYSYSDAATFAPTTVTNTTYATHLAKFKPSTGQLAIGGLYKMNTNGTVATGANDEVWNTNGTTVKISTLFTTESEYLTLEVKNATSPSTPITEYVGVTITNKFTNETIYDGIVYQNTHLVPGTTTYTTDPISIPPGIEYVVSCSYITGYAAPDPGIFLSIPGYSRILNLNFIPVRVDILSIDFTKGDAPSAFLTYTPASGTSVVQWIRNNSHRYAAYFAKLSNTITDGNGNLLTPRGAQMYICQLNDSDSTRFANDNSYLYPTDASVENGDIYMRLPKFYYRVTGNSTTFTVEFADVNPNQPGFQEWDSNNMIAVYPSSYRTGILMNNSSSTKIDAYISSPYFENSTISSNDICLNVSSCKLSSATISSSGTTVDKFAGGLDKASIKNMYPNVDVKFLRYKWVQILRLLFMAYYQTTDCVSVCGTGRRSGVYTPSAQGTQGRGMTDTTSSTGNDKPVNFWGVESLWGISSIYSDVAWQYYHLNSNASNVNKLGLLADNVPVPDLLSSGDVVYKFGSVPSSSDLYYGRTVSILPGTPTTMEQKLTYSPVAFSAGSGGSATSRWFSSYNLNTAMSTGYTYNGFVLYGANSLFQEGAYRTAASGFARICYYGPIQEVYSPTVFYNSIKPNSAIYRRLRGNTAIPAG